MMMPTILHEFSVCDDIKPSYEGWAAKVFLFPYEFASLLCEIDPHFLKEINDPKESHEIVRAWSSGEPLFVSEREWENANFKFMDYCSVIDSWHFFGEKINIYEAINQALLVNLDVPSEFLKALKSIFINRFEYDPDFHKEAIEKYKKLINVFELSLEKDPVAGLLGKKEELGEGERVTLLRIIGAMADYIASNKKNFYIGGKINKDQLSQSIEEGMTRFFVDPIKIPGLSQRNIRKHLSDGIHEYANLVDVLQDSHNAARAESTS